LYKTAFPSGEILGSDTRPNFHKDSGVKVDCAFAISEMLLAIRIKIRFIIKVDLHQRSKKIALIQILLDILPESTNKNPNS
jgi:hypothetical protein